MQNRPLPLGGYLAIAGASLCWGLGAAFAKFLMTSGPPTDPLTLTQVRSSFAFLALLVFALVARRSLLRATPRTVAGLALLGVLGIAASNYTYLMAIRLSNVTTAILVQYTAPIWVMFYMAWVMREHLGARQLLAAALSFGGCVLAVGGYRTGGLALNPAGVAYAVGAALTFAFFNIWGGRMARRVSDWTAALYSLGAATVFWALVRWPARLVEADYSPTWWGLLIAYAVLSSLLPTALFYSGLRRLKPAHAIITATLEPVFAILFAFLLVGEPLALVQLAGMAAVVGAIILLQRAGP